MSLPSYKRFTQQTYRSMAKSWILFRTILEPMGMATCPDFRNRGGSVHPKFRHAVPNPHASKCRSLCIFSSWTRYEPARTHCRQRQCRYLFRNRNRKGKMGEWRHRIRPYSLGLYQHSKPVRRRKFQTNKNHNRSSERDTGPLVCSDTPNREICSLYRLPHSQKQH